MRAYVGRCGRPALFLYAKFHSFPLPHPWSVHFQKRRYYGKQKAEKERLKQEKKRPKEEQKKQKQ